MPANRHEDPTDRSHRHTGASRSPDIGDVHSTGHGLRDRVDDASAALRGRVDDASAALRDRVDDASTALRDRVDDAAQSVTDAVETLKPRLRGWLHAGTFPVALLAGAVLVAYAPTPTARVTTSIYAVTAALLFGVSAVYHRGRWSPRTFGVLQRLDHANIFLIIAGTYTPFAALLLEGSASRLLLWIVWTGALVGVAFRVLWVGAPRWLYTPVYVALGWVAAFFLPDMLATGGVPVVALLVLGGLLYSLGAVVYAAKRPDPSPRWFGFHEVFHAFTLVGYVSHYVAVSLVVHSAA